MRVWIVLLLPALVHAPLARGMAIPMDDEPYESAVEPAPRPAKKARASRIETPPKAPAKTPAPTARTSVAPASVAKAPSPAPRAASPIASVPAPSTPAKPKTNAAPAAYANPPAEKPPAQTAEAKKPEKPKFTCSGRTSEIKELIARSIDTNIFGLTWAEDTPVVGGSARFRVFEHAGDAQIEMINSKGESVGVSPAKVCLTILPDGKKALRVSLQMSKLDLGFFAGSKVRGLLMSKTGQSDELPLVVTASRQKGKIDIVDGADGSMIKSSFTNVGAGQ